jgi:UDP-N-acetylmuramoyl-tripeptide--D-alanyl-D-alanine ligase
MLTKDLYQLFLKYPLIDTDTRNIRKGSIFFALKGERFNANKFAADALEKGAAFVVTDEETDTPKEKTISNLPQNTGSIFMQK